MRRFPSCGLQEGLRSQAQVTAGPGGAGSLPLLRPWRPEKACAPQPSHLPVAVQLLSSSEPWTWLQECELALDRPALRSLSLSR